MTTPIVFDGGILAAGPITGVGRAFLHGLNAYAAIADRPLVLLLPRSSRTDLELPTTVRVVRGGLGTLWRQLRLPGLLRRERAALFHSPVAAIPVRAPCPVVATIHDLPWMHEMTSDESAARWRSRRAAEVALRRADAVLVPSEMTRIDIEEWQLANSGRVHVVPHGVPLPNPPLEPQRRRGPFLVLGDDRPRKNRAAVETAHARARSADPALPDLQFIGPPNHWVSETDKTRLLRHCRGLLHFSKLEGFGLPVLEALGHGAPVACSALLCHYEIAGDCAYYADLDEAGSMENAMIRLHRDHEMRRAFTAAGRQRAGLFTPERVALAWRELHRQLLSETTR